MQVQSNVFQLFAAFFSKLGFFVALPIGLLILWYGLHHQFESGNSKTRVLLAAKLALLVFAGLQLPSILVWVLSRGGS